MTDRAHIFPRRRCWFSINSTYSLKATFLVVSRWSETFIQSKPPRRSTSWSHACSPLYAADLYIRPRTFSITLSCTLAFRGPLKFNDEILYTSMVVNRHRKRAFYGILCNSEWRENLYGVLLSKATGIATYTLPSSQRSAIANLPNATTDLYSVL